MRRIAAEPRGLSTVDRGDLFSGIDSFHIRHGHGEAARPRLAIPYM
jgi:hypothetical protein